MKFPGNLRAESFLATHWQKSTLFMPGAADPLPVILPPEELAWLATLDDVESRLVFTTLDGDKTRYRVESGPFDDDTLAGLPPRDWTLLVQDVDKHLPDFARLLALANFIPDWRIDDLMISFAAPGGSVGPHKDNYDVFLCQGQGLREWHIANPGDTRESDASEQLSLLEPFSDPSPIKASHGDILYLPPGIPHWGIASEACTTYSIGMRAPTLGELRLCYERELPSRANPFPQRPDENRLFYTDPDLGEAEQVAGRISALAIERCRKLTNESCRVENKDLAIALGCVVTDLKAWLAPDTPSADEINTFVNSRISDEPMRVHGMSRIAWWFEDRQLIFFANGRYKIAQLDDLNVIQTLCATRQLDSNMIKVPIRSDLIDWMLDMGVFDVLADDKMPG